MRAGEAQEQPGIVSLNGQALAAIRTNTDREMERIDSAT